MDRLKDKIKEVVGGHKLKIIIGLLLIIGSLMVVLFILIGQRNDNQNIDTSTNQNQNLSTKNFKNVNSNGQASNHFTSTFIDIEGAVKKPGVYQFTNNMRVDDAVNLAGGLNHSADRKHINLAKKLVDQQTVYIPVKGEIKGSPVNSSNSSSESSTSLITAGNNSHSDKVNLNSADVKQLQSINGVGEKRAEKILDYRKNHGEFKQINDLKNVSGIGDKFLNNIKDHVTI